MASRDKVIKNEKVEPLKEIKINQTDKMKDMLKFMNANFAKVKEGSSSNIPVAETVVIAPSSGNIPPPPLLEGKIPPPLSNTGLKVPVPKIGGPGVPNIPSVPSVPIPNNSVGVPPVPSVPVPGVPGVPGKGIPIPPPIPKVVKAAPYRVPTQKSEKKEVKKPNIVEPKKPSLMEQIQNVKLKKVGK